MSKMLSALLLARSAGLLGTVAWAGAAGAIDTLVIQSPQAISVDARSGSTGRDTATARRPDAGSGASGSNSETANVESAQTVGDYQPHMLALAGALLVGYIGLRRPRE